MADPVSIGLIITSFISGITLILQFLQSAKIHNIQISSCMKTTNNYKNKSSSCDSSNDSLNDSSNDSKKKKKKNKK